MLADLLSLLGRELAPAPLERADARVELLGHVGMQDEVVEAARRLDARDLADGDRDQRADAVERGFLSQRAQRERREVGAIERFEHQRARTNSRARRHRRSSRRSGVVPQVERAHASAELPQHCSGTVFPFEQRARGRRRQRSSSRGTTSGVSRFRFHRR